ncbi:MAG: hypothetical protein IPM46_09570 [Flavobacteriales bacterium]|nr:hypothetical protein [Flavobacteriales bacterium]
MRAFSTCSLILSVGHGLAQFPIDQPVTGDTILTDVSPARPFASYPLGSGLMVPYSATRMLLLSATGGIELDAPLSSLHLSTFGTAIAPSGAVMCGKTAAQNAYAGLVNGNGDGFAWIDSLDLENETYFSGTSAMDNGDLVLFGTSYVTGTDLRPIVRRLTAAGTLIWSHHPFTAQITRATHGRELANGDILFTGLDGPPFAPEIKILCGRYSASGVLLGMNRFGNGGFQQGEVVLPAVDGGSIIWGHQDTDEPGRREGRRRVSGRVVSILRRVPIRRCLCGSFVIGLHGYRPLHQRWCVGGSFQCGGRYGLDPILWR